MTARPVPDDLPVAQVLLVDDDAMVRRIAARILRKHGLAVTEAFDGLDALAIVESSGPPDILVSDVMMPGLTGIQLAHRMRLSWPTLPIVLMSGTPWAAQDASIAGVMTPGRSAFVGKPFTEHDLVPSVQALLPSSVARAK